MRRTRIDLLAPPFSGHLHPTLGLARALSTENEVRVLSTLEAQPEIRASGVTGVVILDDSDGALREIVNPSRAVGSNPFRLHHQFRYTLGYLRRVRRELLNLYARSRPNLLIADFTLPVAGVVAAELGIPWWTILESPCVLETPDGPPGYLGGFAPGKGLLAIARNHFGRKLVRGFKRTTFALYRQEIAAAGITELYRTDGSEQVYSAERVLALGVRELEFPRSWPESVAFIGPVLYTPPSTVPAPAFDPGRQHVLVTLGTHLLWLKDRMAQEIERIAQGMPAVSFHFTDGRQIGTPFERGNFIRFPYVDYDQFLHRYDLVVHHGGAGVMYQCLRYGTPAVVYPVDYDQFDHAVRLETAGVAIRAREMGALTSAISQALHSQELARRCAEFATYCAQYQPEQAIRRLVRELNISAEYPES